MRSSLLLAGLVTVALFPFVACGNKPDAKAPDQTGDLSSAPSGTDTTGPASSSGPTTTTTLTLGDGGDLQGSKLTTSSSTSYGTSSSSAPVSSGPHQSDPGRGQKDIQAIVLAHRDEARKCYDDGLKAHPGIEGDLVVQWTIDPKGVVSAISIDTMRSQITEPTVVTCVTDIIKKIKFAESPRGYETKTNYPFNFHPRNKRP